MKIKQNLFFDKNPNKLVCFIDLGDPDIKFAVMDATVADAATSN